MEKVVFPDHVRRGGRGGLNYGTGLQGEPLVFRKESCGKGVLYD